LVGDRRVVGVVVLIRVRAWPWIEVVPRLDPRLGDDLGAVDRHTQVRQFVADLFDLSDRAGDDLDVDIPFAPKQIAGGHHTANIEDLFGQ